MAAPVTVSAHSDHELPLDQKIHSSPHHGTPRHENPSSGDDIIMARKDETLEISPADIDFSRERDYIIPIDNKIMDPESLLAAFVDFTDAKRREVAPDEGVSFYDVKSQVEDFIRYLKGNTLEISGADKELTDIDFSRGRDYRIAKDMDPKSPQAEFLAFMDAKSRGVAPDEGVSSYSMKSQHDFCVTEKDLVDESIGGRKFADDKNEPQISLAEGISGKQVGFDQIVKAMNFAKEVAVVVKLLVDVVKALEMLGWKACYIVAMFVIFVLVTKSAP